MQRSLTTFFLSLCFYINAALQTVWFTFVLEYGWQDPQKHAATHRVLRKRAPLGSL
jgi:hypothetical protein